MFCYLFCLVTAIASISTKEFHTSDDGSRRVEGRIAGGEELEEDNFYFEHQVQMVINHMGFCSGAIINEYYILTAAHCVEKVDPSDVEVRAGSHILGEGTVLPISEIHIHPQYDEPQNNCDIAYMKTTTQIPMGRNIRAAYLAPEFGTADQITVGGWGSDGLNGDRLSEVMMYVDLPVISNMECMVFYPDVGITKNMVCAQRTGEFTKGACRGDGGGPATQINTRRLYGISSFTRGCGPGMSPSVFTYVYAKDVLDFIMNGTKVDETDFSYYGIIYHEY